MKNSCNSILVFVFVFFLPGITLQAQNIVVPQWYDESRYQVHNRFWIGEEENFDQSKIFYDAASYISNMDVKAHTRHLKSGSEGAIWKSSVGGIHPAVYEKGNIAKKIIDLSHGQDLHIICYYRHFEDSWTVGKHPDWQCLDRNGKTISKRGPWVSFATPYVDFLATRLKELIDMGADGFYFDEIHVPRDGDFSEPSKMLFQKRFGRDMLTASADEVENFRQELMSESSIRLKNELIAKKPDIVLLLSANTVRLKLLKDFYVKWEPHFYQKAPGLSSLPIAATVLRDASGGRPTHCWITSKVKDIPLTEVARYLTYNTIYNRDISENELQDTPWKINRQYKEQIVLANKFSPHIAGKRSADFVSVYIYENLIIRKDSLPGEFVDTFNLFRKQMVSVGTITASQINEEIPSACRVICFPALTEIPENIRKAVDTFKFGGGIVLLEKDLTPDRVEDLCRRQSDIRISGEIEDMDVAMYKSDHQLLIALSNGPQKNISVQFDDGFIPKSVFEVISGKSIPVVKKDNGYTFHLDGFEIMAGIIMDIRSDEH